MSNKSQEAGQAAIKAIHSKGFFEIGDNKYTFTKMPFKSARKIFAYLTEVASELETGKLGFLDSVKFDGEIEPLLFQYMLVDGCKVSTVENHFDENASDYFQFVATAIQGFAAPFLPEVASASASESKESLPVILKKQM